MQRPLDVSTKHYFWKPYVAYFEAFELKAYQDFIRFPDGLILDLGCGDGTFTQMLKELLDFKAQLIGGDCDGKKLVRAGLRDSVYSQVLQLDAFHLPFEKESFDGVFANEILTCLRPNPEQAVSEVSRILKRKGEFICTVPTNLVEKHYCISGFLRKIRMHRLERIYIQALSNRMQFVTVFSPDGWCRMLERNGLTIQNVIPFISESICRWWSLLTITPLRVMGTLKIIPSKRFHLLASKALRRLMMHSYNNLAVTIPSADCDYVLIVSKK